MSSNGGPMGAQRQDRRVGRTKRRLKEALLTLIRERGYEGITVEELTARADVGRSTFYSHFTSKEDLLFDGFDVWLRSLTVPPAGSGGARRFHFSLPLLHHIRGQQRFFQATIGRGGNAPVRRRIVNLFAGLARTELDRMVPTDDRRRRAAEAHAAAGAFLGLAGWWLHEGGGMSAEGADEVFQTLARGIRFESRGGSST